MIQKTGSSIRSQHARALHQAAEADQRYFASFFRMNTDRILDIAKGPLSDRWEYRRAAPSPTRSFPLGASRCISRATTLGRATNCPVFISARRPWVTKLSIICAGCSPSRPTARAARSTRCVCPAPADKDRPDRRRANPLFPGRTHIDTFLLAHLIPGSSTGATS